MNVRDVAKHRLGSTTSLDYEDDGECWLGVYNKDSDFLYIGFKLAAQKGKPDFRMLVQVKAPKVKSRLEQRLIKLGGRRSSKGTDNYIWIEKEIPGSEYAGDADKIRAWFDERLAAIVTG